MQLNNSGRHKRVPLSSNNAPQKKNPFRFVVLLAILGGIGYFIFTSPFLKVADIKITGVDPTYASAVYDAIGQTIKEKNVYNIHEGYVSDLISQNFPNLKLNEVKYNFPNKIEADLSQREAKYQVQATNGTFATDEEGFIIAETQEASSSMDIIYDKSLEIGQRVEDVSFQAALIYSQLNQNIKIQGGQIQLTLNNGAKVILPENVAVSKANETFTLLQKIIQKYSIDNRQIEFIDLRFEKPVIKYY